MDKVSIYQWPQVGRLEIDWLSKIVRDHPGWSRHGIAKHICTEWSWRTHSGVLKTFAARSLIDKLERQGLLILPPVQTKFRRPPIPPYPKGFKAPSKVPVMCRLEHVTPLSIDIPTPNSFEVHCFGYYLKHHHYLGFNCTVGENMKYFVRDCHGRDLAVLLFGSAAWKTAPRDAFIGWSPRIRERNIIFLTNNSRFLILPWVQVPNLASHILGFITRRIQRDWFNKYAHSIHLIETFVERDRFAGTVYKAANWIRVGITKGRSRQDQNHKLSVPLKDIWLYPLSWNFRKNLCHDEKTITQSRCI